MSMSVAFNPVSPVQTPARPASRGSEDQLTPVEKIREASKPGAEPKGSVNGARDNGDGADPKRPTGRRVDIQV